MNSLPNLILNPDWQGKIPEELINEEFIKTINLFRRDDIFNHNYDENFLFKQFYKESMTKARRQPNNFMIMRTVVGLVARKKQINKELKDGTNHSVLSGIIWKGASLEEKHEFKELANKFKSLHKQHFPNYEYKPKQKSNTGTIFNTTTPNDFANEFAKNMYNSSFTYPFTRPLWGSSLFSGYQHQIAQHQPIEKSTFIQDFPFDDIFSPHAFQHQQQQPLEEICLTDENHLRLDKSFMINGISHLEPESALNKQSSTFIQDLDIFSPQTFQHQQHQPLEETYLTSENKLQLDTSFIINGFPHLEPALNKPESQHRQSSTIAANCFPFHSEDQGLQENNY